MGRHRIENNPHTHKCIRKAILVMFGNKCATCGYETDERALQLDHIHRARVPRNHTLRSGHGLYLRILSGEISKNDYQLLCANCNWLKKLNNKEHYPVVTSTGSSVVICATST